jgi:hypothetical protein
MAEQLSVPVLATNIDVSQERGKPRLLALLFCDFTNLTKDDKPNLLGVFDRIFVDPEKRTTPPFAIFVRVAEVVEAFHVTFFDPDNQPAFSVLSVPPSTQVYSEGLPRQLQTALAVQFKTEKAGPFWCDVSYKGQSLGGAGLVVEYRKVEDKNSGTDTYI